MKKNYVLFLLSFLLLINIAFAAPKPLGGIVAVVNDEIITSDQLNKQVATVKRQLISQNIQIPPEKVLKKQVLDMLINQELQLQIAKRGGLGATDKEVQEAINNIAKSQNATTAQLLTEVHKQGLSTADFREQIKNQLILNKLQREVISSHIKVSPEEIDTYMRSMKKQQSGMQYHLEDIVIALPAAPTPDQIAAAQNRANELIQKVKAGADFKTLAAAESTGQSALQGGDLGWRSLAEMPAAFSSAIQNLQIGDVTPPIRANDGIHIVSLAGVRSAPKATPEQMKNEVANMLFKRKFDEQLAIWMQGLRKNSYIKIMLPE